MSTDIALRTSAPGRRRSIRLAAVLTLVVAVAAGAFVLTRSSVFSITSIQVLGERRTTEASIIRASGLQVGASALGADLERAREAIRGLPGIASASVERTDGLAVRITVVERTPAIEIRLGGLQWLLDRTGVLVDTAGTAARVPVVIVAGTDPVVGMDPPIEPSSVGPLLELRQALPRSVGHLMLHTDRGISFQFGTTDIHFGGIDRIADKLRAIELVRRQVRRDGGRLLSLDVSAPSRPAAHVV